MTGSAPALGRLDDILHRDGAFDAIRDFTGLTPAVLQPLGDAPRVADSTSKYVVRTSGRRPVAVVICGRSEAGELVRRGVENAAACRAAMGETLGERVLAPLATGEADGLRYAAYPYCSPLRFSGAPGRAHRLVVGPRILRWLRGVTTATKRVDDANDETESALGHIAGAAGLAAELRADAESALRRLSDGVWRPCRVVAHNDLWGGNILAPGRGPMAMGRLLTGRFVVIDWAGSTTGGYGMYDLVRLAVSLRLSPAQLGREVRAHCAALECEPADSRSHLAASLGLLGQRLGRFPLDRYTSLAERCVRVLHSALPSEPIACRLNPQQ